MYEHDRSASKGHLAVREPVFAFKRVGRDTNPEQRARQAMLGCAPAHRLFGLAGVARREGVVGPRSLEDYRLSFQRSELPAGVRAGFITNRPGGGAQLAWHAPPVGAAVVDGVARSTRGRGLKRRAFYVIVKRRRVAPYAGARIGTPSGLCFQQRTTGRPLRGGVH